MEESFFWKTQTLVMAILISAALTAGSGLVKKDNVESSLESIHEVATRSLGSLCVTEQFRSLSVPLDTLRFESARQKADLAATLLQDMGVAHHNEKIVCVLRCESTFPDFDACWPRLAPRTTICIVVRECTAFTPKYTMYYYDRKEVLQLDPSRFQGELQDAISKNLLVSDKTVLSARVLAINASTGTLVNCAWWQRQGLEMGDPKEVTETGMEAGHRPNTDYPWYEDADSSPGLRSPKFVESPPNVAYRGWWTYPYYSCLARRWLISYSVPIPPPGRRGLKGFLSLDVDVSHLEVNQCEARGNKRFTNEISIFHGSHKCHDSTTECVYRPVLNSMTWTRGRYQCICKAGFYSPYHDGIFNGTLVEVAWSERLENSSNSWETIFQCLKCAPGCHYCRDPSPCLATYHWPFRITLLVFTICCVLCTVVLNVYMFKHRKLKVFKVASPIFLSITLFGCATMYLEMAAIFPVLDLYSCIATKWSRHLGFCVTYTALLMKTWRVSLTYRVKSAHKVKLTDKQLLQWMVPILLVMLIYLGTWTLSDTPNAEEIVDNEGLRFKQCTYNWWDHSLAIGEVLFLAWGIRVCYNVRNAESLYNEARLISYAIYNIAIVNIMMIAFHLFIFPRAGPDIKYLLGFIRTQLSTSTTIALVFGPKVIRVLRGQGDQWDNRARSRGVTASFSLNGIGLVPEEAPDLYQENEELKEEIQKLAAQIEFMKIVHMEMNNRHVKPKTGGYFTTLNAPTVVHSPLSKQSCLLSQKPPEEL